MKRIYIKITFFLYIIYFGYFLNKRSSSKLDYNWKKIPIKRTDIINYILKKIKNNQSLSKINYLEIGCFNNENFNQIDNLRIKKYGVDPEKGGNIRQSSDDFFRNNKDKFHCIFIDGLHIYNQVQRDLINSIECLHEGGYIIMHDCIPRNYIEQNVPRFPGNLPWTGDVWKVCVELNKSRGIKLNIFLCDNGVGVIKVNTKEFKYHFLNNEIQHKTFTDFINFYYENLNKIEINNIEELNII